MILTHLPTPADSVQCSRTLGLGSTRCPAPAVRVTPSEVTRNGVTTRDWSMPVCAGCNVMHYPDHSVPLGEAIDWTTDPRVLRYTHETVLARFMVGIERMGHADAAEHRARGRHSRR